MNNIKIQIAGHNHSGKTAIMELIAKTLHANGFQVKIDYGSDGNPMRTPERQAKAVEVAASRSTVTLSEVHLRTFPQP